MIKTIIGEVIHGKKLGRKLGYKTANLSIKEYEIEPGVYKINIAIDGRIYAGIGTHLKDRSVFEAHIFDFEEEIYEKEIEVILLYKLRENRKFDSQEELIQQIQLDIEKARNKTDYVLTFGAFDLLHLGHEHYLHNAKKYGDFLVTIIGTDKNVEKIKGSPAQYNQAERKKHLEMVEIADKVLVGDEKDPMKWIDLYKPLSICLGYDQESFSDKIEAYLKGKKINPNIIRLGALEPGKYKSSILKKLRISSSDK